jgi:cyclophilin family peptidyl-prolyl cis-trans isomerase
MRREALARARRREKQKKRAIAGGVLAVAVIVLFLASLAVGTKGKKTAVSATSTTAAAATTTAPSTSTTTAPPPSVQPGATINGKVPCPKADGSSPRTTLFNQAPPLCIDAKKQYTALIDTDAGAINVNLLAAKAPNTVNNFVVLSRYHFYDGVAFHRVIPGFVDQTGDPLGTGTGGPGYKFNDELPQPGDYKAGSLAMANSGVNTNGSQFFVIATDAGAQQLVQATGGKAPYSLFGQVTGGMDVVVKINNDGSADSSGNGAPKVIHKIVKVTITEA